jgi:hypothetical protein
MGIAFSHVEQRVIEDLLTWDDRRRSSEWFLCNLALGVGGIVMIAAGAVTLVHLNDRVITGVLIPGFLTGLFLVGLYCFGAKRVRERHQLAAIVRKMTGAA